MTNQASQPHQVGAEWSNRILIGSLIVILCLTLFPFQFDLTHPHSLHGSPLLLGASSKYTAHFDFFLNFLLFVPFGFGVSAQAHKRGWKRAPSVLAAFLGGAIASYGVELLQLYIPTRSSGWDDVVSNTTGALAGFFIFEFCGDAISRCLSMYEDTLESWLSLHRAAATLLVYFGVCFGVSVLLQKETRLMNWDAQCSLFVGNDASGQRAWRGQVFRLQIWNRALPEELVSRMQARDPAPDAGTGMLASYEFTTPPPYLDQAMVLPELSRIAGAPQANDGHALEVDGRSWVGTEVPVAELTREIQKANQFTVRIVCAPARIQDGNGRIVSLSQSAENVNFHLRQEKTSLVFFFRSPLSEKRSNLVWYVPHVFENEQVRDIFASYDGSDASIYVDGKKVKAAYHLGPGVSLVHTFFSVNASNLEGYDIWYEMLIFLPAGLWVGLAARKCGVLKISGRLLLTACLLLSPALFEFLLAWVSGRTVRSENMFLSLLMGVVGGVLINSDPRSESN
jgi:hypothetical protein